MTTCPNCKNAIDDAARFCPNCGYQVPRKDGSAPSPSSPSGERFLGVIGGLELKRSFLKKEPVNLVVTSTRTLCVPVATLLDAALRQAESEAKAEGKWFLGRMKAKAEIAKACNFSGQFRAMPPDEIIRQYPATIVIPHADLIRITVKHRTLDFEGEDISSSAEDWPVEIRTEKGMFTLTGQTDPVQQFRLNPEIDAILGDRLKVLF